MRGIILRLLLVGYFSPWKLLLLLIHQVLVVLLQLAGGLEIFAALGVEFVAVEENLIDISLNFTWIFIPVGLNFLVNRKQIHADQHDLVVVRDRQSFIVNRNPKWPGRIMFLQFLHDPTHLGQGVVFFYQGLCLLGLDMLIRFDFPSLFLVLLLFGQTFFFVVNVDFTRMSILRPSLIGGRGLKRVTFGQECTYKHLLVLSQLDRKPMLILVGLIH